MKAIIPLSFAGVVVVLSAQQATPPAAQGPRPVTPECATADDNRPNRQHTATTSPTVTTPQVTTPAVVTPQQAMATGQVFEGTWSAVGHRQLLKTEPDRAAVTVQLSGAVSITTGTGLSRGFRGEAIGFDDGAGLIAARAVWTDDKGDRIFSGIFGDAFASAGRQMRGTITGGTGRYAGITGEYEFRWQTMVTVDDTSVNGRTVDLRGRVRASGGSQ
jgi:hypothetical protein